MRGSTDVSPSTSPLFAFKPRQVLLLEQQQQQRKLAVCTQMAKNRRENTIQLKPEDESILTFSIALWLEKKGFTKVLKRFLSAAQIQDDDWKARALNLDEIFSKYQEFCNGSHENMKLQKQQDEHVVGAAEKNGDVNCTEEETEGKKKKKKKSKGDIAVADAGRAPQDTNKNGKMNESYENGKEDQNDKTSDDHNVQKSKSSKKSNGNGVSQTLDQSSKKKKEKKKENKLMSQSSDAEEKKIDVISEVNATDDGVNESKKASKKRKRMATDENGRESGQEVAVEESKPKKTKGLDEGKQTDENTEGSLNNGIDKLSQPKSANKQQKSSEPKTVNAFQRVKVEEVKFVDERLQDNSYWAKDGAETGYGAKAQEVLGQVRGRDFRHEKTKKKRGSYRGGQIDLQSHSIKFNDSDEE